MGNNAPSNISDGTIDTIAAQRQGNGVFARLRRWKFTFAASLMTALGAANAAPPKTATTPVNRQSVAAARQADARQSPMDVMHQKETYVSVDSSIAQAEERVRAIGVHTIEHGYDSDNELEAAMRNPSLIIPTGRDLVSIDLFQEVTATGKSGGMILQPSPRRVLDFDSAGCRVVVEDFKGNPVEVESDIIYSQPADGKSGYVNPFVRIKFVGKPKGKLYLHVIHYVIMPQYPEVSERELASRLGQEAAAKIQEAYRAGTSLKWSKVKHCGVKADEASRAGGPTAHTFEGWSYRCPSDTNFGGMHAINVFDQGLVADCRDAHLTGTPNGPYVGMPKGFIFGPGDRPYVIPEWAPGPINSSNHGLDEFIGALDIQLSVAPYGSFPGFGKFSAHLAKEGIPPEVVAYADALWEHEIMPRYDQSRVVAAQEE